VRAETVAYATIEGPPSAQVDRTRVATTTGTDEIIRVRNGKVRVTMGHPAGGDHVRVRTANATLEGIGTYDMVAEGDALSSVTVSAGTATLTVRGQPRAVFLATGETWHAPLATTDLELPASPKPPTPSSITVEPLAPPPTVVDPPAPAPREPAVHTPVVRSSVATSRRSGAKTAEPAPASEIQPEPTTPTTAPPPPRMPAVTELEVALPPPPPGTKLSPTEQHFRAGVALLRAGKPLDAAAELQTAAELDRSPLAADARYFQAVALIRAKRAADAERALVNFLDRAPQSLRRGRAAMLLGRLLVDRGDRDSARAWFQTAARDSDPKVANAARAALAVP
jgi:hypothetical protein